MKYPSIAKTLLTCAALAASASVAQADIKTDIQNASSGTTITGSGTYNISGKITVPSGVTVNGGSRRQS